MALDKVKPLKIENPLNGGVQTDVFPTETTPTVDYLACKGIAFENTDTESIRTDTNTIILTTNSVDRTTLNNSGLLTHTGSLKYVDGNQAATKYLKSDANGDATWQPLPTDTHLEVSATASATAPASTDALLAGMTSTPASGTYLAWFSCDLNSGSAGAVVSVSFYVGGTQKADSLRKIMPFAGGTLTSGNQRVGVALNGLITVTGSQTIEVRWSASSGTVTAAGRTMNLLKVA